MLYDTIIIGGGPAGVAAGVYAARKRLKTLVITFDFGGQSVVSPDIQNWIGTVSISGEELAKSLRSHLESYKSEVLEVIEYEKVAKIEKGDQGFKVTTESGKTFEGKSVLVTTGASRRKLNAPGAAEFEQKGITYCATCDGPLFADQDVVVIGGGNAAFESAGQLLAYCKSVTILHHGPEFKADQITVQKLLTNPRMRAVRNAETMEVKGDKFVTGIVYRDLETNETHELPVTGVFVEIGNIPTTHFVKELVETTSYGNVVVDPKNQRTSLEGIWAAGDCTNGLYHQNNIAAGDAIKAIEDIYMWIKVKA